MSFPLKRVSRPPFDARAADRLPQGHPPSRGTGCRPWPWGRPLAVAGALALAACGGGGDAGSGLGGWSTVDGVVSGLAAGRTVVLQLDAGEILSVSANGRFAFATALAAGTRYEVRLKTPPSGQFCRLSQATGIAGTTVEDVLVQCGTAPASGVAALVGDWVLGTCTAIGSVRSARPLLRVTSTGASSFDWGSGQVQYPSANCQGAPTVLPVVRVGSVQVSDIQASLGIAAHWARATLVTGATAYGVWAKRSATELCLVGDESPTLYASANAVASAIEVAPAGMCYTPLRQN